MCFGRSACGRLIWHDDEQFGQRKAALVATKGAQR
jgi:hypothetical protein